MGRYEVADKADEFWNMLEPVFDRNALFSEEKLIEFAKKFYEIIEASGWDSPLETSVGDYLVSVDDESCYKFNSLDYYSTEEELREDFEDFAQLERFVKIWKKKHG